MEKLTFKIRFSFTLLAIILFIYAIIIAKDFLYPIAFGILASYLIYPFVNFLEKNKIPRILAISLSLIIIIILMYLTASFIYSRLENLANGFPGLKKQALKNIEELLISIENNIPVGGTTMENFLKTRISFIFENSGIFFNNVFTATAGTIFKLLLLPVYVFLFLFYRTKFAHFILMITPYENRLIVVKILRDISKIVSKYLSGVLVVVLLLSLINSFGLMIIGLKYAVIIGIISGFPAFIPYFGSILGGIIATCFSVLVSDDPVITFKIVIFYLVVVFIEHNILTPNIVGNNLRINPFIIILSLIIAGTIWGIPGMVVIVPFMAFLKIITKYYPGLKPYAFLLGMRGAKRHAFNFPTIKEIINRKKIEHSDED